MPGVISLIMSAASQLAGAGSNSSSGLKDSSGITSSFGNLLQKLSSKRIGSDDDK